jgi:hypothetical protein
VWWKLANHSKVLAAPQIILMGCCWFWEGICIEQLNERESNQQIGKRINKYGWEIAPDKSMMG